MLQQRGKDDPGVEKFLDYFYKYCMDILFKPFQEIPESDLEGCRETDELRSEHDPDDDADADTDERAGSEHEMLDTVPVVQKRAVLEPTATKVVCCAMVVAFATTEIALASKARGTT